MAEYDLIIRNGHVVDGSGGKSGILDVAVKDGLIQAVGENLPDTASNEIDAAGLIVTPGFVDVHTHYDGQATWDSHLNPSSNLGTTTVVMGNCGVGFAPCKPEDRDVLIQLMEGVEEIPETAMAEGLPWTWESFPEYLDTLDAKPRDIDVAALVPHGPVRVFVMGERAVNRETATDEDISKMQAVIEESVNAGGVGFSTSRTLVHRTSTGSPVPTYKAATHELKQLGMALSGEKGHVFQLISDWEDLDEEFSILRSTSESTGAKGTFTLLHLDNQPDLWRQQLDHIEHAQSEGLDIRGQVLSRPVGMLMGHPASMSPFSPRPTFRSLEDLPWNEKIAKLKTPEIKSQILGEDIDQPHIFVKLFSRRFDKMYPLEEPIEYLPAPDTSVAARAQAEGVEPVEWLYDYFLGNDGNNLIYIPAANFSDHIPELLTHPNTVSALGDGGAHVGSICDASANIYVITKWVKERKSFELEKAIHLLTRQPAELYSLKDRGLIAPGYKADINLIDYEALSLKTPHIVHDLPAGGKRLLQHANGIVSTMVSGTVIYQSGEATGALPGKLVRGQQQDPGNSATALG
ncbi:amidohydrolase family protein [Pseudomonadales bacterium]|nr:amidohydrolase family protein [Pseudomonadales bacterium]MDB2542564.1 amidohydrolase family protein [Pseudomonadales bacterium]MDG1000049.1 amidohydrolase family protein [Pseudomonadales bacterium]MDG1303083.1 amidohydrolase family protein [Pseudomonadales bacterium]MDG1836474.1 amidohydrolase family protein [Pseudomonadales bacterium]